MTRQKNYASVNKNLNLDWPPPPTLCESAQNTHFRVSWQLLVEGCIPNIVLEWNIKKFKDAFFYYTQLSKVTSTRSTRSLKYHESQTIRARELKFWDNVHPDHVSHVSCQVSGFRCLVSVVRCQVLCVHYLYYIFINFLFDKGFGLVDGGSVINGAYHIQFFAIGVKHFYWVWV